MKVQRLQNIICVTQFKKHLLKEKNIFTKLCQLPNGNGDETALSVCQLHLLVIHVRVLIAQKMAYFCVPNSRHYGPCNKTSVFEIHAPSFY